VYYLKEKWRYWNLKEENLLWKRLWTYRKTLRREWMNEWRNEGRNELMNEWMNGVDFVTSTETDLWNIFWTTNRRNQANVASKLIYFLPWSQRIVGIKRPRTPNNFWVSCSGVTAYCVRLRWHHDNA
jgi:hypothetical protein